MPGRSGRRLSLGAVPTCVLALASTARAEGLFPNLFGGFWTRPPAPPPVQSPFVNQPPFVNQAPFANQGVRHWRGHAARVRVDDGSKRAWCVRTCDGRYFPLAGENASGRAELCDNLCPASQTTLVYGGNIDDAATESGKPYSELPNAFRYRNELVAGCTCNGKNQIGLASIPVEDDPTLRKGDIVAGKAGLVVADRAAGRHGPPNFSPAPRSVRAHFGRVPVVAAE